MISMRVNICEGHAKIMVLIAARGLPMAVDTMSAAPHESTLEQCLFDFMLTE